VARTVDSATHAIRREAFVVAATRLFQSKGYEETSVQDILDALGTSRGAFYHYFESKGALLDAVIEQMVDEALASVEPRLADHDLTAVGQLHALFGGIAAWKSEHADLAEALARVWLSDHNALVRDRFRRTVAHRLTPRLADIVSEGVAEGVFTSPDPDGTAEVLAALLLGMNLRATELYLAGQAGHLTYADAVRTFEAYADAVDRILGAFPGSFPRTDERVLRTWFDQGQEGSP
jgi:AcrR family transcriptional regulator